MSYFKVSALDGDNSFESTIVEFYGKKYDLKNMIHNQWRQDQQFNNRIVSIEDSSYDEFIDFWYS